MKDRIGALLLAGICIVAMLGCGSETTASTGLNGSSSSSGTGGNSGGSTSGGSGASTAGTVIANIQTPSGNWRSWGQAAPDYTDCTAPCSESTWAQTFGVTDPSLSGNATKFSLEPNIPYADVLFSAGLIGQNSTQMPDIHHILLPTLHNFVYDGYFYVAEPEITQALEFDVSMQINGVGMTWGHQCNHLGDGDWDIWDNADSRWVSTGAPCKFVSGWNRVTITVQREPDNSLLYQSIALNGAVYVLNKTYPAGTAPANWYGLDVNYQMDSNYKGASNTTYVDNLTLTYW